MKKIFYFELSEAQYDELNEKGWGSEIGQINLNCTHPIQEAKKIENWEKNINDAFNKRFYQFKTEFSSSTSSEEIYSLLQNGFGKSISQKMEIRSMSIGDIIQDTETNEWFLCASVGFEKIQIQ